MSQPGAQKAGQSMKYESALFRARQAEREQANGTTNVELCRVTGQDLYSSVLEYHLDCGRTVRLVPGVHPVQNRDRVFLPARLRPG